MKLDGTKAIFFSITLAGIVLSAPAYASIVSVSAQSDVFAAGVTSIPGTDYAGNVGGNGMAPVTYAVTPGETLNITATGRVNCCDTSATPGLSGPNGFNPNPFAPPPGSTISNSISGGTVGTYTSSTGAAFALLRAPILMGNPFTIGSSDNIRYFTQWGKHPLLGFCGRCRFQWPFGLLSRQFWLAAGLDLGRSRAFDLGDDDPGFLRAGLDGLSAPEPNGAPRYVIATSQYVNRGHLHQAVAELRCLKKTASATVRSFS